MYSSRVCLFAAFVLITSSSCTTYSCNDTSQCGCSSISPTNLNARIIGGEVADNSTWGWMVSMQLEGKQRCGATLLSPEYAVTAAHCVNDYANNPQALSIVAGITYLSDAASSTAQTRTLTYIRVHPDYIPSTTTNDIALIQFAPLTTGTASMLSFICLPQANQDPYSDGSSLVAIGWGVTASGTSTSSDALRQVTVQVLSSTSQSCSQALSSSGDLVSKFCAGYEQGGKGNSSRPQSIW